MMKKQMILLAIVCLPWTSCSTRYSGVLSEQQVREIAVAAVLGHEKWPRFVRLPHDMIECVICQPAENNDGSWSVIAHRAAVEGHSDNNSFIPNTKRILVISRFGKVTRYTHGKDEWPD
jgi:hypothetical protein